jgi:hypothetical protein
MLTERMQRRAIWRLLHTEEPIDDVQPEEFDEPWRTMWMIIERKLHNGYDPGQALDEAVQKSVDTSDGTPYWDAVLKLHSAISMFGDETGDEWASYAKLAATLPPVEWLWEPWIPRGMLSLLGAWQGTGKSWFALDLARIVTQGREWPDKSGVARNGACIYVEAEAVPRITVDRIRSMGIASDKIFPFLPDRFGLMDLANRGWQDRLADMVDTIRPELVIIDSLTNVSETGQNGVEDVKNLLMYLVRLADFANCGLVVIHHLRKPNGGQLTLPGVSIHDFRGSGHITAMARTVLGLSVVQSGKQFSLNGPRRLELAKTNLGPYPDPLGIQIVDTPAGTKAFVYGEAPSAETTMRDECQDWLLEILEDGPMKVKEVLAAGEVLGFGRNTIFRARQDLEGKIVNTKGNRHPGNRWVLHDWKSDEESQESQTL